MFKKYKNIFMLQDAESYCHNHYGASLMRINHISMVHTLIPLIRNRWYYHIFSMVSHSNIYDYSPKILEEDATWLGNINFENSLIGELEISDKLWLHWDIHFICFRQPMSWDKKIPPPNKWLHKKKLLHLPEHNTFRWVLSLSFFNNKVYI